MEKLTNQELFDRYLSIYWVCDSVQSDLKRNVWKHPHVIPEANAFEMNVAYERMEDLVPISHYRAIASLLDE